MVLSTKIYHCAKFQLNRTLRCGLNERCNIFWITKIQPSWVPLKTQCVLDCWCSIKFLLMICCLTKEGITEIEFAYKNSIYFALLVIMCSFLYSWRCTKLSLWNHLVILSFIISNENYPILNILNRRYFNKFHLAPSS
jgi:hypothetical protein